MNNHVGIHNTILKSQLGVELDAKELELIIVYNKTLDFERGEYILKQGDESSGIYIIITGKVSVIAKILGESTTELEVLEPGDSFGESSFIDNIPSTTSVIAASDCKCLLLNRTYLEMITEMHPQTKYKLFHAISLHICKHLKAMHDKVVSYISNTDMPTQSLFMEFYHSLTVPTETTFAEQHIDVETLQKQVFFNQFTPTEIEALFAHTKLISCAKQCTLINSEDTTSSSYIVIQGAVMSGIMYEHKFAKLSVIGPLTLFANVSYITPQHFTITFSTCEKALLLRLTEEDLIYFQKTHPILWYKIFNLIYRSLIELERSVDKLEVRLNIERYNR